VKGYKRTEENKRKVKIAMLGKAHWSRKYKGEKREKIRRQSARGGILGGLSSSYFYKERRKNFQVIAKVSVRRAVFERNNYTCQNCGYNKIKRILEIDHKIPVKVRPELRKNVTNMQVLCPNCHAEKTLKDLKKYKELYYRTNGKYKQPSR